MLKSVSERTPPCGTPDLNWVDVVLCICYSSFHVVSDEFSDVVGYASVCELVN